MVVRYLSSTKTGSLLEKRRYISHHISSKPIKKGEKVDPEMWKLYNVARCFYSSGTSRLSSSILTSQTIKENLCLGNKNILFHRTGDIILSTDKENNENIEKLIQLQERYIELHIEEQNKQILVTISKQEKTREKSSFPDLPVKFPVDTDNNLKILDEILRENTEIADCLCSYLSSLGGKDATNRTNRIFKYILSDEAAKNYNFYGKRTEKEAFCHFTLCSIIVQAVKISHSGTSDKDVEDIIKVWLKHAPERISISE
ncbi:uncharacterized protein LOC108915009 [Anoplophora glabripennis]|uniref:uncharacterized protein LOC108915009 n=1 Tax=Anoplophora glabripennis TaxID=217634 RepID=UPI0008749A19|nr:uncharacterized protein LOC108915009 [Anoplophora glabripennis]